MTRRRTSATSKWWPPSNPKSTAAWNAAIASRCARAATSPPPHASASCCAARSPRPRRPEISASYSCTEGFRTLAEAASPSLRVLDAVAFVDEYVLPRLPGVRQLPSLVLHPTCASTRLGLNEAITRIAERLAREVTVPQDWQCCGFAGDRGMLHPELTAAATRAEAAAVTTGEFAAHASVNRPCDIAMTRATGRPYRHILELLDHATTTMNYR